MVGAGVSIQIHVGIGIWAAYPNDVHIPSAPLNRRWKGNAIGVLAFIANGHTNQPGICLQRDRWRAAGCPLSSIRLDDCAFGPAIRPAPGAVPHLKSPAQFNTAWHVQSVC